MAGQDELGNEILGSEITAFLHPAHPYSRQEVLDSPRQSRPARCVWLVVPPPPRSD